MGAIPSFFSLKRPLRRLRVEMDRGGKIKGGENNAPLFFDSTPVINYPLLTLLFFLWLRTWARNHEGAIVIVAKHTVFTIMVSYIVPVGI